MRLQRATAAAVTAALAYAAGAPFTFLDLPGFRTGFGQLMTFYQPRPLTTGADVYVGHLWLAIGWWGLVLVGIGFVIGTARVIGRREPGKWALLIAFPLAYFYMIATKQLIFGRYLLPHLPFLCLPMAIATVELIDRMPHPPRANWLRPIAAPALVPAMSSWFARHAWPREFTATTRTSHTDGPAVHPDRSGGGRAVRAPPGFHLIVRRRAG